MNSICELTFSLTCYLYGRVYFGAKIFAGYFLLIFGWMGIYFAFATDFVVTFIGFEFFEVHLISIRNPT